MGRSSCVRQCGDDRLLTRRGNSEAATWDYRDFRVFICSHVGGTEFDLPATGPPRAPSHASTAQSCGAGDGRRLIAADDGSDLPSGIVWPEAAVDAADADQPSSIERSRRKGLRTQSRFRFLKGSD
jgi:hypothetical protein